MEGFDSKQTPQSYHQRERLRVTVKTRRSEVMGVDWARLPGDLLIDIAMRFICVEDLFAFFAVCSSWYAVSSLVKPNWSPGMPWLMTPDNSVSHPMCNWTVFDPNTYKCCKVDLPDCLGWSCCCRGDGDGWIFTVGRDMKPCLFNPLTRARLCLPPVQSLPILMEAFADCIDWMDALGDYPDLNEEALAQVGLLRSVTLVKIPPNNGFLVLVVSGFYRFAFAEPGKSAWYSVDCTHEQFGKKTPVMDVIAYNGQILILHGDGKLVGTSVDSLLHSDNKSAIFQEYVIGDIHGPISIYAVVMIKSMYLVKSRGDLLLVVRYKKLLCSEHVLEDCMIIDFETMGFEVFKLDLEVKDWASVNHLGDVSLFVGNCSAVAVCLSNANCKSNCIYFTDDKHEDSKFAGYDAGIFHLCDWKIEELDLGGDPLPKLAAPFWLMPRLV